MLKVLKLNSEEYEMCVWYDVDFPGGAHDIGGQNKGVGQNWAGYCAEECDKITDCSGITVGKFIS